MTREEMKAAMAQQLEDARQHIARVTSRPLVICIEALGYRIVPTWMIGMIEKTIDKASDLPEVPASVVSPQGDTDG